MKTKDILELTKKNHKWAFLTGRSQWENWLFGEAWIADRGVLKLLKWRNGLEKKSPQVKIKKQSEGTIAEIDMRREAEALAAISMLEKLRNKS